jgi:hypothetical protein
VVGKLKGNGKQSEFDTQACYNYNCVHGPLAQLAEQLTLNQQVTGSIPVRLTIFEAISTHFSLFSFSIFSILSNLLNKIPVFSLDFA